MADFRTFAKIAGLSFSADTLASLEKLRPYFDEYSAHKEIFLKDELSLSDYCSGRLNDLGLDPMSDDVADALVKLQGQFGRIHAPGEWLGSKLEA